MPTNSFIVPLAYKFVATAAMLGEASYCARSLHLDVPTPIRRADLQLEYVSRPKLSGFGGVLETTNYAFGFSSGRLRYITKLQAESDARSTRAANESLAA